MREGTVVFQDPDPEGIPKDRRLAKWFRLFDKVRERPGVEALVMEWKDDKGTKMNNATWQRKVLRDRAGEYLPPGRWRIRADCQVNVSRMYVTYYGPSDQNIPEILAGSRGPAARTVLNKTVTVTERVVEPDNG